jgi:hypothetical protein
MNLDANGNAIRLKKLQKLSEWACELSADRRWEGGERKCVGVTVSLLSPIHSLTGSYPQRRKYKYDVTFTSL